MGFEARLRERSQKDLVSALAWRSAKAVDPEFSQADLTRRELQIMDDLRQLNLTEGEKKEYLITEILKDQALKP